ncbi:MAG: hypothetical protein V4537_05955 [Pseudomonadota bacterium]
MKFISKLALGAALTAGMATTVAVAPAAAQKKKDEKAAAGPKLSEAIRKPIAAAQTAIAAKDYPTALAQLAIAEPLAASDDEKYFVNALKLAATAPSNEIAKLTPMLDALLANPRTPPAALGQYNFLRGEVAMQQKKYAEALPFLNKAQELGFKNDNLQLHIASAMIETGNVSGGLVAIEKAIAEDAAAGRKSPEDWYNYAIARVYKTDPSALAVWSRKKLAAYPTPANWRQSILLYRDSRSGSAVKLDRGQQIDLFRLMRATKSLADRGDYLEYADLTNLGGFPSEAKAVLEEGRATGKIPAGDAIATRLMTDVNTALKLETSLAPAEAKARAASNGRGALGTADAYLGIGQTAKAIELYLLAQQKGGIDASELNLHLGAAYAQAGQTEQAKAAFNAITAPGPRKDIAAFWLQYLNAGGASTPPAAAS